MDKLQDAIDILRVYNQEHIIKLLEKLNAEEKEELLEQINKIDFQQMKELYDNTKKTIELKENKIEPLKYCDKSKLSKMRKKN